MDAIKTKDSEHHSPDEAPLQLAIKSKNFDSIHILLRENQDVNVCDNNGRTALHELLCSGSDIYELLDGRIFNKLVTPITINAKDNDGNSPLHLAIKEKHYYVVAPLVDLGADVDMLDANGQTPLHTLCKVASNATADSTLLHHKAVAHQLVSHNNINLQDSEGNTPLHLALKHDNRELTFFLQQHGADLSIGDSSQQTALHLVLWKNPTNSMIKHFMSHDNINLQDNNGNTPLHIAIKALKPGRNCLLNEGGSDADLSLFKNRTPLSSVIIFEDLSKTLDILLSVDNINLQDHDGNSPLHLALKGKQFNAAFFLLQRSPDTTLQDSELLTPLHVAIHVNAPTPLVRQIISRDNVNIKDKQGNTALFYALESAWLLPLFFKYRVEIDYMNQDRLKLLAEATIRTDYCSYAFNKAVREHVLPIMINFQDQWGKTVLHHLVQKKNNKFLMDMLQSGLSEASKDIGDKYFKRTPLHYAITNRKLFDENIIDALITPTNVNMEDTFGNAPLHMMMYRWPKQFLRFLDGNVSGIENNISAKLITKQTINLKSNSEMTLLRFIVNQQRWDLIPYILEKGADVGTLYRHRLVTEITRSILHDAIKNEVPVDSFKLIISHENAKLDCSTNILCCAVSRQRWDLMQLLLDHGADINAPCRERGTALHAAIQAGNASLDIIAQLISPQNIEMKNRSGETAMKIAIDNGQWHILKLLLSHGYRKTGPLFLLCGLTIKQYVSAEKYKHFPKKFLEYIEDQLPQHFLHVTQKDC